MTKSEKLKGVWKVSEPTIPIYTHIAHNYHIPFLSLFSILLYTSPLLLYTKLPLACLSVNQSSGQIKEAPVPS